MQSSFLERCLVHGMSSSVSLSTIREVDADSSFEVDIVHDGSPGRERCVAFVRLCNVALRLIRPMFGLMCSAIIRPEPGGSSTYCTADVKSFSSKSWKQPLAAVV